MERSPFALLGVLNRSNPSSASARDTVIGNTLTRRRLFAQAYRGGAVANRSPLSLDVCSCTPVHNNVAWRAVVYREPLYVPLAHWRSPEVQLLCPVIQLIRIGEADLIRLANVDFH